MSATKLDQTGRRVLAAVLSHADATPRELAEKLGMTIEVVEDRIARMEAGGILQGRHARVDAAQLGLPHEMLVQAVPSGTTTRDVLDALATKPGITRVFTVAQHQSVLFTIRGRDLQSVQDQATQYCDDAGLLEATFTLIVNTLHDNPSAGLSAALNVA